MIARVCLFLALLGCAASIRCYICNSIDEPECQKNPPEILAADCAQGRQSGPNTRPGVPNAVACWSQRQDVKGTSVVVRHCGGLESTANGTNTGEECYDRVGSKNVRVSYCKCDKDLCNSAKNGPRAAGPLAVAALSIGLLVWFNY